VITKKKDKGNQRNTNPGWGMSSVNKLLNSNPPSGNSPVQTVPTGVKPLQWLVGLVEPVRTPGITANAQRETKERQGAGSTGPTVYCQGGRDNTGVSPKAYCRRRVLMSNRFGIGVVA
jgi:hypothetical protein